MTTQTNLDAARFRAGNGLLMGALMFAVLALPTTARAQDRLAHDGGPEFTPYVFLGSNASSGVGGAVRWPLLGPLSLELETSARLSKVSPLNANLSLLFDLPRFGRTTPYVAAGVGLDQYAFADTSPTGRMIARSGTAVSVNAGGGVRVRATDNLGIRTDARWSNGLGGKAPERWRLYNGVTIGHQAR